MRLRPNKDTAKKLRKMRENAGFTQDDFADTLNVARRTYHNWENAKGEPRASLWERIKKITAKTIAG